MASRLTTSYAFICCRSVDGQYRQAGVGLRAGLQGAHQRLRSFAAARTFAASFLSLPLGGTANVDGDPRSSARSSSNPPSLPPLPAASREGLRALPLRCTGTAWTSRKRCEGEKKKNTFQNHIRAGASRHGRGQQGLTSCTASAFHRPPTSQPSTHMVCAPVGGGLAPGGGAQNISISRAGVGLARVSSETRVASQQRAPPTGAAPR